MPDQHGASSAADPVAAPMHVLESNAPLSRSMIWRLQRTFYADQGIAAWIGTAIRRAVAPLFARQGRFNAAVVDHLNRNVPVARETRASVASTLTVLRDTIAELVRFQSLLIVYLQQVTPYVDTRDRDVAGVVRGLSSAINAVADEVLKTSDAGLAHDRRQGLRLDEIDARIAALRTQVDDLSRALQPRGHGTT